MNLKKLALGLLSIGVAGCVSALAADPLQLQFTNITAALYGSNYTATLNAVTFGGSSNFLAVGNQKKYILGNFVPGQPWFTHANWATNQISVGASNVTLAAVASSGNLFAASGDNNLVFSAANVFSVGGLTWATNYNVFPNSIFVPGMAFNGTNFVAVGEAPEIFSSGTNLPENKNWNTANFIAPAPSFLESFRGITPFRGSGFAACGIAGDVRLSSDGINWSNAPIGSTTQPDFFSIADDGHNTLVCVGVGSSGNGIIQVFTNISTSVTPLAATNLSANNSAFNSVAYTGSGFVAVGNDGQLFTSTNGVNWFQVPPTNIPFVNLSSAASLNLYGVAFGAPGSLMQDIGEIVGTNGNVIVCAPPPPTNSSLGNKWISVGVTTPVVAGTNVMLPANTLQVTNAWGTNLVTVDWYDARVGGNLITSGTFFITNGMFSFTPPFITDNSDNHTNHYWAQARDLRTGFINTNRTEMVLTNFMRPTAAMITTNTICNGDATAVQVKLTGNGPWTVHWTNNFTSFTTNVGSTGVYHAASPFIHTLNLPQSFAPFNPTNVFLNLPTNFNYSVWSLSDTYFPADDPTNLNPTGTNWAGDLTGSDLVTVNPRPTASLVTAQTICNGQSGLVQLQADLTGLGPWTVTWSDGYVQTTNAPVGSGAVVIRGVAPMEVTNVFLDSPTNYTFTVASVTNADTCSANQPGDLTCTNTVTVNPRPTASLMTAQTICNGQSSLVQLQANLTGLGPWTVIWSDGVVQTTNAPVGSGAAVIRGVTPMEVTNVLLNNPTNYFFTVTSVTNADTCMGNQPGDLTCTNLVTVNPRPMASLVATQTICNGQSALVKLQANLTGLGPWTVTWSDGVVQTTNAPVGSGAVAIRGVMPQEVTNSFPNSTTNYTFTVTSMTNADTCAATQPGDLTCTNTVTVYQRPTATVSGTRNVCNGQPAVITAALTGTGPAWIVTWEETWPGGTNILTVPYTTNIATLVVPTNLLTLTNTLVNSPTNYTFTVVALSDSSPTTCGADTNDLFNNAVVTVYPRPTATVVSGSTNICSGLPATIQADLTGTGPAWNVTWGEAWAGGSTNFTVTYNSNVATLTVPTNGLPLANSLPNSTTNYTFTVSALSDSSPSSCGASPGDLHSNAVVKVYPLPTATIIQVTNSYYNLVTFDDLLETTNGIAVTNGYVGLNWVDFYEVDGLNYDAGSLKGAVVSTNNVIANGFGLPASITNATPFNLVSAYMTAFYTEGLQVTALGYTNGSVAYSNVYTLNTNSPAFILFNYTNVNGVVFSTTNADFFVLDNVTVKQTGPTEEICNGDVAVLQSVLTGIGPWTVQWTNGTNNYTQVVNTNVAGPYINDLTIPNTAFNPTNVLLNQTTNYSYTITGITTSGTNGDMCSGSVSGGPAMVTVSPRPTAYVTGNTNFSVNGTNPVTAIIQVALTGFGPWNVTWSDGTNQICTNSPAVRYVTDSLSPVVNQYTNFVYQKWNGIRADGSGGSKVNNAFITTNALVGISITSSTNVNYSSHKGQWQLYPTNIQYQSSPARYYNYFTVQTNVATSTNSFVSATYQYSVTNLTDAACKAGSNDLAGSAQIHLEASASASISVSSTNICLGDPVVIAVALSGTPPWTNFWSDGTTNVVSTTSFTRTVIPGNTGWYTNTITNLVDGIGVTSTNISGNAAVYVNPLPAGLPVPQNQTNCAGAANFALTATDTNLLNWYDANTNFLVGNTNSFTPTNTAPGTWTYYVAEISPSGCVGTNFVPVSLVLLPCTNPPAITLSGTNGTVRWFGNLTLQDTTNLAPPVVWQDLSNGIFGTNVLFFTNGVPPWTNSTYFFRLNTN